MKAFIVLALGILLIIVACTVEKPSLPTWDVDLAIPLINEEYFISDLVDSVNIVIGENQVLHLIGSGEVDTPEVGTVEMHPNLDEQVPLISGMDITEEIGFIDSGGSAELSYGKFSSGIMRIRFSNVVPQTEELRITFTDISTIDGNPLQVTYDDNEEWQDIDLTGCVIGELDSPDILTDLEVSIFASSSLPDGTPLALFDIELSGALLFEVFQGILHDFEISMNNYSSSIDIDYPSNVDEAITLSDAHLEIDVTNNIGFDCEFIGFFEARRGDVVERKQIVDPNGNNYRISAANSEGAVVTSLIFDEGLSRLMQIMPESIQIVDAMFLVDSASGAGTLRENDTLVANYVLDAPFRFTLHESPVMVEDAIKINISEDNKEYISEDLQSASLEFKVWNKIPVGGKVKAYFSVDEEIDPEDSLSYAFYKEIEVASAQSAPDWQNDLEPLVLSKQELDFFSGEQIYLKWEFIFEASQGLVEITASSADFMAIKSTLRGKLRINGSEL
ncbi:MAG: hypothetical protein LHW48_07940 [Candidatus Cloacimonetes bacterium]|nr:hypothetical protein [Candidatus Cloacimonadota bacterium]